MIIKIKAVEWKNFITLFQHLFKLKSFLKIRMSEKKSKSKSKDKVGDKPPKDTKPKKDKGDDTKSKKSVDK